jgi:hypothetical protein
MPTHCTSRWTVLRSDGRGRLKNSRTSEVQIALSSTICTKLRKRSFRQSSHQVHLRCSADLLVLPRIKQLSQQQKNRSSVKHVPQVCLSSACATLKKTGEFQLNRYDLTASCSEHYTSQFILTVTVWQPFCLIIWSLQRVV